MKIDTFIASRIGYFKWVILLFFIVSATFFYRRQLQVPKIAPSGNIAVEEAKMAKLMSVYSEQIKSIRDNKIWFKDGTSIVYDSKQEHKDYVDSLEHADVQDQFTQVYLPGKMNTQPARNHDPGRIRCDTFFKKMYGSTPAEVESNLEDIIWCPKMVGQKIRINKRNRAAEMIKKISLELDGDTTLKPYLSKIGGSFVWRKISGTNRNSTHSYGITIDINTSYSSYWQWDCKCTDEYALLGYTNKIPMRIIEVFEKYGFIWGGKWYHYDTMHFEYRPELL